METAPEETVQGRAGSGGSKRSKLKINILANVVLFKGTVAVARTVSPLFVFLHGSALYGGE